MSSNPSPSGKGHCHYGDFQNKADLRFDRAITHTDDDARFDRKSFPLTGRPTWTISLTPGETDMGKTRRFTRTVELQLNIERVVGTLGTPEYRYLHADEGGTIVAMSKATLPVELSEINYSAYGIFGESRSPNDWIVGEAGFERSGNDVGIYRSPLDPVRGTD